MVGVMGVFARFRRLLRGRLYHEWYSLPDPALERICRDIEIRLMKGHAEVLAGEEEARRLAAMSLDAERQAAQMLAHARRALGLHREDWAREAVTRHLQALRRSRQFTEQWRCRHEAVIRLRQTIELLQSHLANLEFRRQLLQETRGQAQAQRALVKKLPVRELRATGDLVGDDFSVELTSVIDSGPDPVDYTLSQLKQELSPPGGGQPI